MHPQIPQFSNIQVEECLVRVRRSEGDNLALQELADVKQEGETQQWTDVAHLGIVDTVFVSYYIEIDIVFSHQATSVWGWVLLAPVVVQGMVDSKVPLQSHSCNVQWTIFHRDILHYSAHTKFNISRWTFSFHTSIVRILIESAQFYESWLKVRGCNAMDAFNFRSVWLKGTLCKRMHPMMVSLKINGAI